VLCIAWSLRQLLADKDLVLDCSTALLIRLFFGFGVFVLS
jgi:hypothetical protein